MVDFQLLSVIAIISFVFTVDNLIKKHILKTIDVMELICITPFIQVIFIVIYLLLSGKITSLHWDIYKKLTPPVLGSIGLFAMAIFLGTLGITWLTKKEKISTFMPIFSTLTTIFTFLGGVFLFKEKVTKYDYFALVLMSVGIYIMEKY